MEDAGLTNADDAIADRALFERDALRRNTTAATAGYRDGLDAGKEAFLQVAFEAGFGATVHLSRIIGEMRGCLTAAAALSAAGPGADELGSESLRICAALLRIEAAALPITEKEARGSVSILLPVDDEGEEGGAGEHGVPAAPPSLPIATCRIPESAFSELCALAAAAASLLDRQGLGGEDMPAARWGASLAALAPR